MPPFCVDVLQWLRPRHLRVACLVDFFHLCVESLLVQRYPRGNILWRDPLLRLQFHRLLVRALPGAALWHAVYNALSFGIVGIRVATKFFDVHDDLCVVPHLPLPLSSDSAHAFTAGPCTSTADKRFLAKPSEAELARRLAAAQWF